MNIFLIGGVTVERTDTDFDHQRTILQETMTKFGRRTIEAGDTLLVCSPYDDSADPPAVRGAADALLATKSNGTRVQYHFPDSPTIVADWKALSDSLACPNLQPFRYRTPMDEAGKEQLMYAWLLAQLSALQQCQAVLAVGGKVGRAASMLLALAMDRRIPLLPLPWLGGAADICYERLEAQLKQYLGEAIADIRDPNKVRDAVPLLKQLFEGQISPGVAGEHANFFISYPKSRPQEADVIENVLLRFQHRVFRDDKEFRPGAPLPEEIKASIHKCTIFIAVWCREYACSPWCFDEMEIALRLKEAGHLDLWIFCVDETRIVPPKARNLLAYPTLGRKELEGELLRLLVGRPSRHQERS